MDRKSENKDRRDQRKMYDEASLTDGETGSSVGGNAGQGIMPDFTGQDQPTRKDEGYDR